MLVCPSCHSTNPDTHKFCQRCGTSLTEKDCPKCSYKVPYEAASCPNCHQFTGQIWRVSIEPLGIPGGQIEPVSTDVVSEDSRANPISTQISPIEGISPELQSSPPPEVESAVEEIGSELQSSPPPEVESTVDEISPELQQFSSAEAESPIEEIGSELQPSPPPEVELPVDEISLKLDDLTQANSTSGNELLPDSVQKPDLDSKDILVEDDPVSVPQEAENTYLDSEQRYKLFNTDVDNIKVLDVRPLQATVLSALPNLRAIARGKDDMGQPQFNIPKIAIDYLKIQEICSSAAIPTLHDAWQDDEKIILLLEDRSQWATLAEFWSIPEVQTTKILSWMTQMAELWAALEVEGYRQSLLNIDNLKLDEDETIALEKLYIDEDGAEIELRALGEVWHQLFGQSAKTQFLSLSQMLRSMCNGEIKDINQLKSELRGVHEELQPTASATGATDFIDSDLNILQEELDEVDESPTLVLPKRLTAIEDAGATHPGKQRPYNEDFFAIETKTNKVEYPDRENITARGLYILCDGMGGHAGGEVASKTAVKTIKDFFEDRWEDSLPDEDTIKESIFLANQELYNLNQKNASSGTGRMGTTLVMLLIHNTKAAIAHVGDSRLYSMTKQSGLQRLTVDHEVGQREIQRGVEESIAYSRPDAYQLTQALGPRDRNFIKPDVKFIDIDQDILLILGSDGLTDNDLLETYGSTYLLPLLSSADKLDRGANKLIELANEYNGHDNITTVLVRVRAAS